MNNTDLPPLPALDEAGPEVCATIRLYLAVWDDLSPVQVRQVSSHVLACADCAREQRLMRHATQLVGYLEPSEPSARVDQAVMAAIAARSQKGNVKLARALGSPTPIGSRRRKSIARVAAFVAIAAAIVLVVLAALSARNFLGGGGGIAGSQPPPTGGNTTTKPVAFSIPANVSWNNYTLYHIQTMSGTNGGKYTVTSYHNMADDSMHVETVRQGRIEVVMISDGQKSLGLDMKNHVAQWGADAWGVDESMFDLTSLRNDLKSGKATFKDKSTFNGQDVYRIQMSNGDVLLLDMHYLPVNVMESGSNSTAKPMYDTLEFMPTSKVPDSIWDMSVPKGFKMGALPAKPQML